MFKDILTTMLNKVKESFAQKPLASPVPESQTYDSSEQAREQQFWDNADLNDANEAQRAAGMSNDNLTTNQMVRGGQLPAQQAEIYPQRGEVLGTQSDSAQPYRNPNWAIWQRQNPKGFEALLAGAKQASEKHGVPPDMLMDVSGLETSGGTQLGSPEGHTAGGYFMFNDPTLNDPYLPATMPDNFDRNSATDSADLAAQLIKKKQLSRWAVAKGKGAGGDSLTDFYSNEELAPFLK